MFNLLLLFFSLVKYLTTTTAAAAYFSPFSLLFVCLSEVMKKEAYRWIFADAYTGKQILYEWQGDPAVSYAAGIGLALSQFDLISSPYKNLSLRRQEGKKFHFLILFELRIAGGNVV